MRSLPWGNSLNAMRARIAALLCELEQRDGDRREWIAQVSHDLRTPMMALSVGLERGRGLLASEGRDSRAEAAELVEALALDARRVQALAEDQLEIARLDFSGALHVEPVPVGELLRETVTALIPLARERSIELDRGSLPDCRPSRPTVADGEARLRGRQTRAPSNEQQGPSGLMEPALPDQA